MQSVKGRKQAYVEYEYDCSAVVVASPLHASAAGGQAGRLVDAGGG